MVDSGSIKTITEEVEELRRRLAEAEQTLEAMRNGEVDAVVVSGPNSDQVYTLTTAERPYRMMIEQMNEGAVTVSSGGTILYCNESFARMVKMSREKIVSTSISEYIAPASRHQFLRLMKHNGRGEISLLTNDKAQLRSYFALNSIVDGQSASYSIVVTDLAEHVQNEQIIASERFSRTLLEQAADAVLVCDPSGTVIQSSEKAFSLFGADMLGWTLDQVFSHLYPVPIGKISPSLESPITFANIRDNQIHSGSEVALVNGETKRFLLINHSRIVEDNIILGYSISLSDITQRKKVEEANIKLVLDLNVHHEELKAQAEELKAAQQELEEARNKYEDLYNNAPIGYLTLKTGLIVSEANMTAARLLGMEKWELNNFRFTKFIMPEGQDDFYFYNQQILTSNTHQKLEIRMKRGDGSHFYARLDSIAIRDAEGKLIEVRTTISDITELKQIEDALKSNNERLKILSEASSLLLSSDTPEQIVQSIANQVMRHLNCDCFFNYIADEKTGKLRLNAYAGVPEVTARSIEWLDFGSAICGCVGRDGCRIVSEDVQKNGDMRAALVRSLGVQAYACHPLKAGARTIGTLSFGTRTRNSFTDDELRVMKTIADLVSVAMERRQVEEALAKANDDLELKVKGRTRKLVKANKQLNEYSHRITQVQEEERKRIAYELHDDTAQYLAILKLQLDSIIGSRKIQDPAVLEKLEYLEKDAGRAVDDVRRYSHELRPSVLEHMGLQAALEQIAEDINKLKQFEVEVNVQGAEPELTEEVKLGFFRIAQEALNNCRKHAKATKAVIKLRFYEKRMIMSVSDNGKGFDMREAVSRSGRKGSLGLMSMRERAKLMGALLKIDSEPGKGTTVIAEIKL